MRGSAFIHTARRELYVADELARALHATGCVCGNIAAALWRYGAELSPFGLGELFATACAVERTLGDRRLGTHVLAGLQLLLPLLVDPAPISAPDATTRAQPTGVAAGDVPMGIAVGIAVGSAVGRDVGGGSMVPADLLAIFPSTRPNGTDVATADLMTDAMLAFELQAGNGLDFAMPREPALFADATNARTVLRERAPPAGSLPSQWTQEGAVPMASKWQARFELACAAYEAALAELRASGPPDASVLGYVYARIGHECGRLLRTMHDAGYSWGTYQDAMCFDGQWHCNAHSNNVILLSEREAARAAASTPGAELPLCACVDFDMAFTARSFVDMASGRVGCEPHDFARLLERERLNFCEVLAGGDSTSGVPQVAMRTVGDYPPTIRTAQNALSDTLVRAFLRAVDAPGGDVLRHAAAFDPLLHRASYALLRMAIIVMAECIA